MKNIGRIVLISILAVCCIVVIVLLGKAMKRQSVKGITHNEMAVLWEGATGEVWQDVINGKEVIWQDVLSAMEQLNHFEPWNKAMQDENSKVYQGVQKMSRKYQNKDRIARDDWYGFYQILCTFFASEKGQKIELVKAVMLDELDNDNWFTNDGTYMNEADYKLEKKHNYWIVDNGEAILSVWKECDEEVTVCNVLFEEESEKGLNFFYDNRSIYIDYSEIVEKIKKAGKLFDSEHSERINGRVGDVCFENGKVKEISLLGEVVTGKVMQRTQDMVVVGEEDSFQYILAPNIQVYKTYSALKTVQINDIPIGYEYADFILRNGEVSAVLLTRDKSMESIRVLIKNIQEGDFFYEEVKVTSDMNFHVIHNHENSLYCAGEQYGIRKEQLEVGDRIFIVPEANSGQIICKSIQRSQGVPSYRGHIEVLSTQEGLVVVNEVLLEDYLYTVVPSEMPHSYPMEALKAQAICARTYGYNKMLHALYPQWGAHLDDTTTCQVYNNQEEHVRTNEAIRETFGLIAMVGEDLIDTFYYSTSCGFSTTEEIWGNGKKYHYLQAGTIRNESPSDKAEDEAEAMMDEQYFEKFIRLGNELDYECEEPWYRWSYHENMDKNAFMERLQRCYQQFPDKILLWNEKSCQYESTQLPPIERIDDIAIVSRLPGGVAHEMEMIAGEYKIKVITEQLIRTVLPEPDSQIIRWDGSKIKMNGILPSAFIFLNTKKDNSGNVTELYINGGGYGHGVGMSQNAAAHMAETGMSMYEILAFFYNGITLTPYNE